MSKPEEKGKEPQSESLEPPALPPGSASPIIRPRIQSLKYKDQAAAHARAAVKHMGKILSFIFTPSCS